MGPASQMRKQQARNSSLRMRSPLRMTAPKPRPATRATSDQIATDLQEQNPHISPPMADFQHSIMWQYPEPNRWPDSDLVNLRNPYDK